VGVAGAAQRKFYGGESGCWTEIGR